jgi:uncharacterized protein YbbK (DUF523 family)
MANKDVYVGGFQNDMQHGSGVFTSLPSAQRNSKIVYDGEFFQSKRSGQGVLTVTVDGKSDVYQGQFKNNLIHGEVRLCLCVSVSLCVCVLSTSLCG